jgi:hypothetical protein
MVLSSAMLAWLWPEKAIRFGWFFRTATEDPLSNAPLFAGADPNAPLVSRGVFMPIWLADFHA